MATHTITRDALSIHPTLTGTTVDAVTVPVGDSGDRDREGAVIEVVNRSGTATIWFTVDGTTPAVSAPGTWFVLPGGSLVKTTAITDNETGTVKLIGDGNSYSVTVIG